MLKFIVISAFALSATTASAEGKSLNYLGLMLMIQSVCELAPPPGIYQRELARFISDGDKTLEDVVASVALEAVRIRSQIGTGSEGDFCYDVKKTYGPNFYGE